MNIIMYGKHNLLSIISQYTHPMHAYVYRSEYSRLNLTTQSKAVCLDIHKIKNEYNEEKNNKTGSNSSIIGKKSNNLINI